MLSQLSTAISQEVKDLKNIAETRSELSRKLAAREIELLAKVNAIERLRKEEEELHQQRLGRIGSTPPLVQLEDPQLLSPTLDSMHSPSVLVPIGKSKELPDHAIVVLRGLWARLGYQGSAFVDMQLEINKELDHADFARFEREMLCNEIISLRQELDVTCKERNEQTRRADTAQINLAQVIEAEERTFKTLLTEREVAKRALERAEKGVQKVVIAKEKEAVRAEAMSEELHRLEKERVAALLFAKTAEEQAAVANMTAKAAAAVAVSAVQSPRSGGSITPRTPVCSDRGIPSPKINDSTNNNQSLHSNRSYPHNSTASTTSHLGISTSRLSKNNLSDAWSVTDEAILQSKIREKNLEEEEARLASEATKIAKDRIKLKMDQDRLLNLNCEQKHHHHHHHHPRSPSPYETHNPQKSVVWNNPLAFSLD
ncbi:hypothetical protein BY996DRAFT_7292807 [Phakopsora pachyrhizi]|uniref:Uncharacterized protein n=1 Tax=Phakopsora pachyrhizi TaxID=170000 RepID=A0AAV0BH03_PHAPC|nr:hypothetical protein BY996DRAFT_7639500 [Phakopsora pachyrhizi]KAI8451527.1 hypothetical protein BY996DRAFT_7292807 [Phakopsora pachyrhizi]CAH7686489.1 hypothetical protein PPACK8108_LOCUS21140 [Phakopsora pachyrhizi]